MASGLRIWLASMEQQQRWRWQRATVPSESHPRFLPRSSLECTTDLLALSIVGPVALRLDARSHRRAFASRAITCKNESSGGLSSKTNRFEKGE